MKNLRFRAEIYGNELAINLSKILNGGKNKECMALSCALAIEGLKFLCMAEVIDIISAWEILKHSFQSETRPRVIKRY